VVNKERKIKAGVDKEFRKFEGLIRNLNFFKGLIKNFLNIILLSWRYSYGTLHMRSGSNVHDIILVYRKNTCLNDVRVTKLLQQTEYAKKHMFNFMNELYIKNGLIKFVELIVFTNPSCTIYLQATH
jgi:hypothetical protein